MSRGIVLWPDTETSGVVKALWETLAHMGIPSMAGHTHCLHQPHVALAVAEDLPVEETLKAVGRVPTTRIHLSIEAAGIFPGGILYLACVANQELLDEQRRVQLAVSSLAVDHWPHFEPGAWTPPITMGWSLTQAELAGALPVILDALPLQGWLSRGGLEDGTTGESWIPTPA